MSDNKPPPSGTVTFLFTDIEGSTALYENYRYQMQTARKRHDEILREAIESHRGYVFKTVGDAFCAAFNTAKDALQGALAAQRALFAERWPQNVEIRVRMGLHTGVAEESEGDYFGPPVNRVARLMSTGHGRQTLLSDPTYNLVRDELAYIEPEGELQYLGEHRLKDFRYTERIFQLLVPDLPKEFEPLRTHSIITPEEVINLDRHYQRIRFIGGGGFGSVYLVRHEALDRNMALKVLVHQYAQDEQFVERFKREARSAAQLSHPNIVQVYDAGQGLFEGQKTSYIAMEYVPGGTLEDLIAQQSAPLPPGTTAKLTLEAAKALEVAHRSGVIHRDIKPQNILITQSGEAKVADFGIARATASSTKLTRAGFLMGTLSYISPEQARGELASPRSDLYSLGVVLYQMLTGELPFDAETPAAVMVKHISELVRPPKEVNPKIPDGLNEVCVRLLAKDPNERYPDAGTLIKALERVKDDPHAVVKSATGPTEPNVMAPTVLDDLEETRDATVRGPTLVEVPDLVGQKLAQARGRLAEVSLSVGMQREASSETVPEGEIIEQEPAAGMEVEAGSLVSVALSLGSGEKSATVPDVSGRSLEEARRILEGAGLVLARSRKEKKSFKSAGTVISTEPSVGSQVDVGSSVTPIVSSGSHRPPAESEQDKQAPPPQITSPASSPTHGQSKEKQRRVRLSRRLIVVAILVLAILVPVAVRLTPIISSSSTPTDTVPDLRGETISEAAKAADEEVVVTPYFFNRDPVRASKQPKGTIINQIPKPGHSSSGAIFVELSGGQERVKVPDVSGMYSPQAGKVLIDAGLEPELDVAFDGNGNSRIFGNANKNDEKIGTTDPPSGEVVDAGTHIVPLGEK